GLAFDSMDGEPTYIVVLLAGPENIAPLQVKVLANISRVLKEESVRDELRRAPSAEAFLNSLRLAEAAQIPS
ncbi:MAG: PTS sugar transporter subunit IIA, partial [bacterium]